MEKNFKLELTISLQCINIYLYNVLYRLETHKQMKTWQRLTRLQLSSIKVELLNVNKLVLAWDIFILSLQGINIEEAKYGYKLGW